MPTNITFRTQLLGGVSDFCADCGLQLFTNPLHLVELIVALARYKEEGVRLNPQVYVASDIAALAAMLPDGERLKIGTTTADVKGIKEALKKTAPLATDGWSMYVQILNGLEYGVFRGSGNPLSVAVDDVLLESVAPLKVVKIFCVADECVEIRASTGHYHHIFLDHRKEDTPPPLQYLDRLVSAITNESNPEHRDPLRSFLKKLLFTAMRESHGCLIAVTNMTRAPAFISGDGIFLETPIDFVDLVAELKRGKIDTTVLTNKGSLLKGMLNSDGIILFDERGRLLGYNCFVKVKHEAGVVGGARRRAFAALQSKVGNGLAAAFMQSQDGWTDFKGVEHV
ncbi:hypothetical protein [Burkholderia ubonensis]|uniref:hypothetical protein n=1 Tax=Burkholderia ubonensis TaxID=101571 RepID=UPI000A837FA5|nr:hypothetical protein [Burkholderia ubonensis]